MSQTISGKMGLIRVILDLADDDLMMIDDKNIPSEESNQILKARKRIEKAIRILTTNPRRKKIMSNNDTECELAAWELLAETRRELDALKSAVVELERELIEMGIESARLITAVNDAIRRPLGVVPASAEEFYRP